MANLIGIYIPHRNMAQYIGKALESIRKQDIPIDVVIVDDSSDRLQYDHLREVAGHIPIIRLPTRVEIGISQNVGIAYLNTPFVLPLAADDWLCDEAIKSLYSAMSDDAELDFVYGNYFENYPTHEDLIDNPPWIKENVRRTNITSYCMLWRTSSLWRVGGFSDIHMSEDWELQARAIRANVKTRKVNCNVFHHLVHSDSKLESGKRGGWGYEQIRAEIARRVPSVMA
jgi:glycosyltransferase involved in cell wall biosynthesis